MRSIIRYYEHKRSYDRDEFYTLKGKRFVKKRAHKRFRRQVTNKGAV